MNYGDLKDQGSPKVQDRDRESSFSSRRESGLGRDLLRRDASEESSLRAEAGTRTRMRAAQESALRQERRKMEERRTGDLRREAKETAPSIIAQVVGRQLNGTWTVTDSEGRTILNVQNMVPKARWRSGQWVTAEQCAGDWQIVGVAHHGASDPPLDEPPGP